MAKRIIWTSRADAIFTKILEFYVHRNQSKTYSRKLNQEIHQLLNTVAEYPLLGIKTNVKGVRVVLKKHYKVFYEAKPNEIIVHLIWDTRQDPNKLKL